MGAQTPDYWDRAFTSAAQCGPELVTLLAFCPVELSSKEPWKKCCYGGPEDGAQRQQTLLSPYSHCQSTKQVEQMLAMGLAFGGDWLPHAY